MYLLSALLFYVVCYINIFFKNNILVDIINSRNYKYINNSLFYFTQKLKMVLSAKIIDWRKKNLLFFIVLLTGSTPQRVWLTIFDVGYPWQSEEHSNFSALIHSWASLSSRAFKDSWTLLRTRTLTWNFKFQCKVKFHRALNFPAGLSFFE